MTIEHNEPPPRWMTTRQVAARIGQSPMSVRRLLEAGTWPGAYQNGPGGHWRVPEDDVQAWLESMRPKVRRRRPA